MSIEFRERIVKENPKCNVISHNSAIEKHFPYNELLMDEESYDWLHWVLIFPLLFFHGAVWHTTNMCIFIGPNSYTRTKDVCINSTNYH